MNCTVRLIAAVAATLAAAATAAGPAQAADRDHYVALGDSFTAAPFVLMQYGTPIGCGRSDHNYPSVVKAAIGATVFRDESCSSATTKHMTEPQSVLGGNHIPQFDALSSDATLVTVGIGGNDVGLVGAATECIQLGLLAPTGTACRSNFAKPEGGDRLVDKIAAAAPKIAATLQGIRARSPQARVLIVGYPAAGPTDGRSCYPLVPMSSDDLAYLDEMLRRTNTMIAEQAAANGAEFVDTYTESIGHDVCTLPPRRWFEGVIPTMPAFPVHPNVLGEASMARSVLRVLGAPRPAPVLASLRRRARSVTVGRAARFTYVVSRPAQVRFTLQRAVGRGRYAAAREDAHRRRRRRREHAEAHGAAARPPRRAVPPGRRGARGRQRRSCSSGSSGAGSGPRDHGRLVEPSRNPLATRGAQRAALRTTRERSPARTVTFARRLAAAARARRPLSVERSEAQTRAALTSPRSLTSVRCQVRELAPRALASFCARQRRRLASPARPTSSSERAVPEQPVRAPLRSARWAATARSANAPIEVSYWARPASDTVPWTNCVPPASSATVWVVGFAARKRASCSPEMTWSSASWTSRTSEWIAGAIDSGFHSASVSTVSPKKRLIWLQDELEAIVEAGGGLGLEERQVGRGAKADDAVDRAQPLGGDEREVRAGGLAVDADGAVGALARQLVAGGIEDVLQAGGALLVVDRDDAPAAGEQQVAGAVHEQLLGVGVVAGPATGVDEDHRAARRTGGIGADRLGDRCDDGGRRRLGLEQRAQAERRGGGLRGMAAKEAREGEQGDERESEEAGRRADHAPHIGCAGPRLERCVPCSTARRTQRRLPPRPAGAARFATFVGGRARAGGDHHRHGQTPAAPTRPVSMRPGRPQPRTRARARRGRLRPPPRPVRELTRPSRVDPPTRDVGKTAG